MLLLHRDYENLVQPDAYEIEWLNLMSCAAKPTEVYSTPKSPPSGSMVTATLLSPDRVYLSRE